MDNRLNIEELVDVVKNNVTLNCRLPYVLEDGTIERIVEMDALRYFHEWYKYGTQVTYYYLDLISFFKNKRTGTKFITLPDEIQSIRWIYKVGYKDMHNMGYLMPRNGIGMGQTSHPFVATINISEFVESVAVMQTFQDALATFSKSTIKPSFNSNSKRFEVMTDLDKNLILECRAHIPDDALFGDYLFIRYVTGRTMIEYSNFISFTDMQFAGNTKISTDRIYEMGNKYIDDVEEKISKMTTSSFIINKTR